MKSTGITRTVDELGRVVLPIELRKKLDIEDKDILDIAQDGDAIILRKHVPCCIFCGEQEDIRPFSYKGICPRCLGFIKELE